MDKALLDTLLADALKISPFKVTGDGLQSKSITALFEGFLSGGALAIDGAAAIPPGDRTETVIAGTLAGPLFGAAGLHAEARFSVVAAQAEVRIILTNLPAGWKPSSSFAALAGGLTDRFAYASPILTLDSRNVGGLPANFQTAYDLPANSPALEATVKKGLSLAATVTPDASNAVLTFLLKRISFPITCPIELAAGIPRLRMTAEPGSPFEIGGLSFPIAFDYVVSYLELAGTPPVAITSAARFSAAIDRTIHGTPVSIPIAVLCDDANPSQLTFSSGIQAGGVPIDIADIPGLIAGASIEGQIPSDFAPLADLTLLGLEITLDTGGGRPALLGIAVTVGYPSSTSWRPFGDLIRFHDINVVFSYAPGSTSISTDATARAEIGGGTLDGEIVLPAKTFSVVLEPGSTIDAHELLNSIVDGSVSMPSIVCTTFDIHGDAAAGMYRYQAVVESAWSFNIGSKALVLNDIGFDVTHGATGTTGQMVGTFTVAGTELRVCADYKGGVTGWDFTGGTPVDASIPVMALVSDAAALFGLTLPSSMPAITIVNIDMTFESGTHNFFFSAGATITIAEREGNIGVLASNTDDAGDRATVLQGFITIGGARFEIDFTSGAADRAITAAWTSGGTPLDFGAVAAHFGLDLSGVPSDLIPRVTSAAFTYDFTTKTLVFNAVTGRAKTVFISTPAADGSGRIGAALLGVDISVSLADLPIVGRKLAAVEDMGIDGLQLLVTSAALAKDRVAALNALIPADPAGLPRFPEQDLDKGVMLSIPFHFGGVQRPPLAIRYSAARALLASAMVADAIQDAKGDHAAVAPGGGGSSVPGVAWLKVERGFGPISVKRIGVGYHGGKVVLAIDAGFALSAVSIELDGLTLGFTLHRPPSLSPALHGMGISFNGGPVAISGGFLDVENADGTHEYDGTALISAENFTLSAIGSYATTEGAASLFIFAMLDAPLGGPPFFFVTGVAAGFGVNRSLTLPTLDTLPAFPLVAAAMAGETGQNPFAGVRNDPAGALAVMQDYIQPAYGANWFAAGVRFTSFEMIQSFALITVMFGTSFEVALLGLSTITIPTNADSPIGFAELALKATFSPARGVLGVSGKLTPQSYILSQACHLTGGFAFYTWLTDSNTDGAPAGDFVITLGGYHPSFNVPSYYPQVPRIGANWQVSGNLTVKGGLYFALTPTCVMAGGSIEAVWQSGDLKAWFNAEADFLLSWKPFHYQAFIGLSLGASYKVDLLFTSFTVTVHLGVDLNLWGPSFAGTARVDLYVVSFTISFGDSSPNVDPISWDDFKTSFLPKPGTAAPRLNARPRAMALAGAPAPIPTDSYCYVSVADGLIKDLTKDGATQGGPDWVINGEKFRLVTHSALPCTHATLVTGGGTSRGMTGGWTADGFGVGPVGVANGSFVSHHVITVNRVGDSAYDFSANAVLTASIGNAPKAAWSSEVALSPDFSAINSGPSVVANTLSGFVITSLPNVPDSTVKVEVATLLGTLAPTEPTFSWSTPGIATTDGFNQATAMQTLMSTIDGVAASAARAAILETLVGYGLAVNSTVDVSRLAAGASTVLLAAPVLSLLGEETEGAEYNSGHVQW